MRPDLKQHIDAESLDRQAEHERRCRRIVLSQEMEAAATAEALEHNIILSNAQGRYLLSDERHVVAYYPATQVVMRSINGRQRLERIDLTAEADILDIVILFAAGKFLEAVQ